VTEFGLANPNPRPFWHAWENPSQSEWMTVSFETPDWSSIQASSPKHDRFPWSWVSWKPDPLSDVETSQDPSRQRASTQLDPIDPGSEQ